MKETTEETLIRTGKDSLTDVGSGIAGGFAGAIMGKYSFLTGFGISASSHFFKKHLGEVGSRIGSPFGVGMMAGGSIKTSGQSVSGTEDKKSSKIEEAKQRSLDYWDDLLERTHVSKLIPKKKKEEKEDKEEPSKKADDTKQPKSSSTTTAAKESTTTEEKTVGEVQYFIYPNKEQKEKELDLSSLDHVEDSLHQSAAQFQQKKKQDEGTPEEEEMKGTEDELDPEEKNY